MSEKRYLLNFWEDKQVTFVPKTIPAEFYDEYRNFCEENKEERKVFAEESKSPFKHPDYMFGLSY